MPKAPKPQDEQERLAELKSYNILDTSPELRFDRITQIASKVIGAPVALISLVDEDRQWFKSKVGLDVSETPRDLAFCAYAVNDKKPFIVEDATTNERVSDNPLVIDDPNIRFYAGVPIITPRDRALGTLCVIDTVPRKITDTELEILKLLAEQVATQMEYTLAIRKLQDQKLEIEKSSRSKSVFLSSMSHELRTPMNAIIGFTKRVLKRVKGEISPEDIDSLETVERNADQLLVLINDIINLSRLDTGAVQINSSEFDISLLVQSVVQTAELSIINKGLEFDFKIPKNSIKVTADRNMILQILNNLVENAIRFTDQGKIEIFLEEAIDSYVIIKVRDTGIGIAQEDVEKLFQKFTQCISDEAKRRGGTGIGLSISQEYAKLHGGQINVSSSLGNGSEFTLKLPILDTDQKELNKSLIKEKESLNDN